MEFGQSWRTEYDNDNRKVKVYGYTKGLKCKECKKFYHEQCGNKVITRCRLQPKKYWKANMPACNLFKGD